MIGVISARLPPPTPRDNPAAGYGSRVHKGPWIPIGEVILKLPSGRDRLHLVGFIAGCIGWLLLVAPGPIGQMTEGGEGSSPTLGLRLAGVRDLAIAAALLAVPADQRQTRAALARIVTLIQIGDVLTASLMRARGKLGTVPLLGVILGAAATEALVVSR